MAKVSAAFEKVFGGVNNSFLRSETKEPIRKGKTARDKANGHVAYKKNIREWVSSGSKGSLGEWVKR